MSKAKKDLSPKSDKTQQETVELREQLARVLADYDNLQKRISRSAFESEIKIKAQILSKFLPVFDMLESIQNHLKDSGLAMVMAEFETILKQEGVEIINPKSGEEFDENLHEVVEAVFDKSEKGSIVKLSLTGYKINDYIIRPAKVVVSQGKEKN